MLSGSRPLFIEFDTRYFDCCPQLLSKQADAEFFEHPTAVIQHWGDAVSLMFHPLVVPRLIGHEVSKQVELFLQSAGSQTVEPHSNTG